MPRKRQDLAELTAFVKANINKIPLKQMARELCCSLGTIKRITKDNRLKVDPAKAKEFRRSGIKGKTTLSAEHDLFIQENYLLLPCKTIASQIGRSQTIVRTRLAQLGLRVPEDVVERFKRESRFTIGREPKNKGKKMTPALVEKMRHTFFQKGHKPINTLFDGATSVRKDKNGHLYTWVRVSLGKWRLKQVVEWETKYGPIPKGHVLRCKSHETTNPDPANWELISKRENAIRNSGSRDLSKGYVLGILAKKNPELRNAIRDEYPELIEVKTQQLQLNRKIKNHEQKQNPRKNRPHGRA